MCKNHYEMKPINEPNTSKPNFVLDTKNPVNVGDKVYLCDEGETTCFLVKAVRHYLRAVPGKGDGQFCEQTGSYNCILDVEKIVEQ